MRKRMISILIAIAMIVTMVPFASFADEAETGEEAEVVTGLQLIDGNYYYFDKDGNKVISDFVAVDGDKYYFDENGKAVSGKKKIDGTWYCFYDKSCKAVKKGWRNSKTMYCLGGGKLVTGPKKIGKTVYFFNTSNAKRRTKKGFFKYNGGEYYSSSKGVLKTGFQAIKRNGKLNGYYFYKKTGKMAKDTTIGHLRIPKSGKLKKAYAYGIRKLNKNGWKLRKAYNYSAGLKYYDRWYRKKTSEQYAIRGFTEHRGNCYVMAATFYIQAKLLGYNVRQMQGKVSYRYPHSWTVIKHNGKWYVYDPCFTNEHNKNGFKIYYGKKGTWRYTNKKRMN